MGQVWDVRVSIPWREFGDSDRQRLRIRRRILLGFNSLAGVRGFGLFGDEAVGSRGTHGFNSLAGVRGFGQSPIHACCDLAII